MAQESRSTGTARSRAHLVRRAVRKKALARLALSAPSGGGKTWTALSIAEVLAPKGVVVLIDTEPSDGNQGAAELYADRFDFDVIEWQPPYDPRDLAITVTETAESCDVLIIDSASHFWRGEGGTLDIAGGQYQGWKTATPAQDQLVEAILRCQAHVIVCTRAKQDYQAETGSDGKMKVTKLGLAPIQRDDLEYEFQVVVTMDQDHKMEVGKTRAAPLAGLSFNANQQGRFAETYKTWLDAGQVPARQRDVDAIRRTVGVIAEETARVAVKRGFKAQFGEPEHLSDEHVATAWAWLAGELAIDPHPLPADVDTEAMCPTCGGHPLAGWHTEEGSPPPEAQEPPANGGTSPATEPEGGAPPEGQGDTQEAPEAENLEEWVISQVATLDRGERIARLEGLGLDTSGSSVALGKRLVEGLVAQRREAAGQ